MEAYLYALLFRQCHKSFLPVVVVVVVVVLVLVVVVVVMVMVVVVMVSSGQAPDG